MFTKEDVNSSYILREDLAAVKSFEETTFKVVSMEEALNSDYSETRNVIHVLGVGLCAMSAASRQKGGAAVINREGVFIHESGVGGWNRVKIL